MFAIKPFGYTEIQQSQIYLKIYRRLLAIKQKINTKNNNSGIQYTLRNIAGDVDIYRCTADSVIPGDNNGAPGWHPQIDFTFTNTITKETVPIYIIFELHHGCSTTDPVPNNINLKKILKHKMFKLSIFVANDKPIIIPDWGYFGELNGLTDDFIKKLFKDNIFKRDPPGQGPPAMLKTRNR